MNPLGAPPWGAEAGVDGQEDGRFANTMAGSINQQIIDMLYDGKAEVQRTAGWI